MQITSKFTIAVHIITCVAYFGERQAVTSAFLSGSVGVNPVIVRGVMGALKEAGILKISQGKSGIALQRPLDQITLYDVYEAVHCLRETGLFHFHENPNAACPVGRNIHRAMDDRLQAAQRALEAELRRTTLAEIVEDTVREILAEATYIKEESP